MSLSSSSLSSSSGESSSEPNSQHWLKESVMKFNVSEQQTFWWYYSGPEGNIPSLTRDITAPDVYAEFYLSDTVHGKWPPQLQQPTNHQAAQPKKDKYARLSSVHTHSHIFCPVAIETSGAWNGMAVELMQKIGRCITTITEDTRETTFFSNAYRWPSNRGSSHIPSDE